MNWDQIEAQWHQVKGHARSAWTRLTDDDIKSVAGNRDLLIGKVQARYGVLKDEAERQVEAWTAKFAMPASEANRPNGKDKQPS